MRDSESKSYMFYVISYVGNKMSQLFDKIVEETRKAKAKGYDWEKYAKGRTIEEVVMDNLAEFYVESVKQGYKRYE